MSGLRRMMRLRGWLAFLVVICSLIFIVDFVTEESGVLSQDWSFPSFMALFIAFSLTLIGHLINACLWWYSLNSSHADTTFWESYRSWSLSRLARYVPGKVAAYFVRFSLHRSQDFKKVVSASLYEIVASLVVLLSFVVVCVAFYAELLSSYFHGISIGRWLIVLSLLAVPGVVYGYRRYCRYFDWHWKLFCRLIFVHFWLAICHGLAFFILLMDLAGVEWGLFPYVLMSYGVAGLWGQLALVAPAGVGVREAGLMFFLNDVAGEVAGVLMAVMVIRLILVVSDVLNAAVSTVVAWWFYSQQRNNLPVEKR